MIVLNVKFIIALVFISPGFICHSNAGNITQELILLLEANAHEIMNRMDNNYTELQGSALTHGHDHDDGYVEVDEDYYDPGKCSDRRCEEKKKKCCPGFRCIIRSKSRRGGWKGDCIRQGKCSTKVCDRVNVKCCKGYVCTFEDKKHGSFGECRRKWINIPGGGGNYPGVGGSIPGGGGNYPGVGGSIPGGGGNYPGGSYPENDLPNDDYDYDGVSTVPTTMSTTRRTTTRRTTTTTRPKPNRPNKPKPNPSSSTPKIPIIHGDAGSDVGIGNNHENGNEDDYSGGAITEADFEEIGEYDFDD